MRSFIFPLTLFCGIKSCAAYNYISDMCARWDHQSTIKNNKLYIDGGAETFGVLGRKGPNVLGYNKNLITVDLSQSWDWKSNITETSIDKTANPETGTFPPSYLSGAMFQGPRSSNLVYTYGGTHFTLNKSFETIYAYPSTYSLWSFDTSSQVWSQYDISAVDPLRPSKGGYAEAPDQGLGFWFNGQADQGSSTATTTFGNDTIGIGGFLVMNFTDSEKATRNFSTTSLDPTNAVNGGSLTYLPYIGTRGALVEMGGVKKETVTTEVTEGTLVPFTSVNIFDIASSYKEGDGKWYTQNTSGAIPDARIDYCAVIASAPDKSSHNLYLYGGRDPIRNAVFDDIYVLSMPTFSWVQIYSGESPRYGHTCHLVANRQMLTVGGSLGLNVTKDCDWEQKGVAILDMSTKTWGSVYNAQAPPYLVVQDVVTNIGGNPSGGATLKAPANGWADPGLQTLFARIRSPDEPSAGGVKSKAGGAVIAGATAGSICGLALIGTAILLCVRRRNRNIRSKMEQSRFELGHNEAHPQELDEKHSPVELPTQASEFYELPSGHKDGGMPETTTVGETVSLEITPSGDNMAILPPYSGPPAAVP